MVMALPSMLIVVRAGRSSLHQSWSHLCHKIADVAVSVYDDTDWSGPDVNYLHYACGGKFKGIKDFFNENPQLIDAYDYVWAFEDDLLLPYDSLLTTQSMLAQFGFQLAAPALSPESFFSWAISVRNERMLFRATDFVEIMAPIMSRDFLRMALPYFDENHSGWGYEWLWRKFLDDRQTFAAILDAAPIVHTRPQGRGSLYRNLPPGSPEAQEELKALVARFGLPRHEAWKNLFGLTNEAAPRLIAGDDLLSEMLSGYRRILGHKFSGFVCCINNLMDANRPVASLDQLRHLDGFSRIEATLAGNSMVSRTDRAAPAVVGLVGALRP